MKRLCIEKIGSIFPSILVVLIHFILSVRVGPQANVVRQQRFDTGAMSTGSDAVVAGINNVLSVPIPAVLFAKHPSYELPLEWWLATLANSVIWGIGLFMIYSLMIRIAMRWQQNSK